ncbi:TetR/AcrR family transcriptional regulator [Cupriavidus sp. CP313]
MDHATRLFIEHGFGATSVEAIAAAGISKKTYYTRFAGKAEVFEAAVLRYWRRTCEPDSRRKSTASRWRNAWSAWPASCSNGSCDPRS